MSLKFGFINSPRLYAVVFPGVPKQNPIHDVTNLTITTDGFLLLMIGKSAW